MKRSVQSRMGSFIPFAQHYLHNVTASARALKVAAFPSLVSHIRKEKLPVSLAVWLGLGERSRECSGMQADSRDSVCILVLSCGSHTAGVSTRDLTC